MLLKAVLIVCVVRKERKIKRLGARARVLFPRIAAGTLRLQLATGRREPYGACLFRLAKGPFTTHIRPEGRFFGPRSYDASGEVGGYLYEAIERVLLIFWN